MTRKNKIGSIFLVSMLALAGLGISYAGFSDIIYVSGTVNTAELDLTVLTYSGTWVWKSITTENPHGYVETHDPDYQLPENDEGFLVASAFARVGGENEADVVFEFDNLFPCVWFWADFVFKYEGTIPVRLWADIYANDVWLEQLWAFNQVIIKYEIYENGVWEELIIDENGYQVHGGEEIKVWIGVHIPQDNMWQKQTGSFGAYIYAYQWNEIPSLPPPSPPVHNLNKNTYYLTIQPAIDDANPGDMILVDPGTYPGNIIVYKEGLTIKSTGSPSSTIVDASQVDYSTYQNAWGKAINYAWAQTYDPGLLKNGFMIWSDDVTIDGFSIINANHPADYNRGIGVLIGSISTTYAGFIPWNIDQWGGLISPVDTPKPTGIIVRNNIIDGASDGIYNWASSGNIIEYNTISNTQPLGGTGIQAYQGGQNNIIRGNTITNAVDAICVAGAWPDVLLDVSGTQIYDNTLTNNVVGIKFYNIAGSGVVAQYNNIYSNGKGIYIEGFGGDTVAVAHYNNIVGNTIGVDNAVGLGTFDAEDNWWGASDGPSSVGPGSGDPVSNNVDYDPWAASAFP